MLKKWANVDEKNTEEIQKELIPIVERFLKEQDSKASDTRSTSEIVLIVCSIADSHGEYKIDKSFKLDYANKTVDGHPANFSDIEVTWSDIRGDSTFNNVLNRHSGAIRIGSEKHPSLFFGQCARTTERKF